MANFEMAAREKYRFPFKGSITTEDLWDLSLEQLNAVFQTLSKEKKTSDEDSLLITRRSKEEEVLANRIEIVKHIFSVKQSEALARVEAAKKKAERQKILEIIADKENEALKNLSLDELKRMVDE